MPSINGLTLHDMWVHTYSEDASTLAYSSMNSFSHALLDVMRDFSTAEDVRAAIASLRKSDGNRWNYKKQVSVGDAKRMVASLCSRRGVPKVLRLGSAGIVSINNRASTVASQVAQQESNLVCRDEVAYFTKFTVPQLIQLNKEGIFPVRRNGSRVGYTDRQVQGLAILNRINANKDLRAVRSAIAEGALSKIEDESLDFSGKFLVGYGARAEWVANESVNSWLCDITAKLGQGYPLNLISYDETVSRLEKLKALLHAA